MGIMVISYTLKDVKDDVGYLASLGQARTAQVKRDAIIGFFFCFFLEMHASSRDRIIHRSNTYYRRLSHTFRIEYNIYSLQVKSLYFV